MENKHPTCLVVLLYLWVRASLVAQLVKNLPAMQETWVWFPGLGRSPGEGNSYLLQYFGLENSLDWIIHGSWRGGHNWVAFTFSFLLESGLGSSAAVWTVFVIISGVFLVMACCFSQCRFPGSLLLSNFPGFFLASVIRTLTHSLSLFPHYLLTFSQSLVKMHFFKDKLITRLLHCGWLTWYRIVYTDRT